MKKIDFTKTPSRKMGNKIKHKGLKITFLILLTLIIAIIIGLMASVPKILSVYHKAILGKQALEEAQVLITKQDLSNAHIYLTHANEDFKSATKDIKTVSWIKIVPFAGTQISAAEQLLKAGVNITNSLEDVAEIGQNILAPLKANGNDLNNFDSLNEEQKQLILKNLKESSPGLERSLSELELGEIELSKMPTFGVVSQLKEAETTLKDSLPEIKKILKQVVLVAKILPSVAGYPEEQTYLFLLQNNTELRPTGGFWGSYGILRVENGEVVEFKTDDTYNLDSNSDIEVTPPWQLPKLINPDMKSWYFRDANWSPDFPTSAEKAIWFYNKESGQDLNINGVIAITPDVIHDLLSLVGPITASGTTFTEDNLTEELELEVEKSYIEKGIELHERKDIIGVIANQLMDKLYQLPREKWSNLISIIEKSFLDKQAFLYLQDENNQKFIEENNFAGNIRYADNDFLMVVDSNMASLKTDSYVNRASEYNLKIDEQKALVTLKLTYQNNAPGFTWKTTRYRDWVRIYVPLGSTLNNIEGNEQGSQYYNSDSPYEINEENGKTVFGTFVSIEPGETKTITFTYELPTALKDSVLKNNQYKILIQKQGGIAKPDLNLSFSFPKEISYFSHVENGKIENDKTVIYDWNLEEDREILIDLK